MCGQDFSIKAIGAIKERLDERQQLLANQRISAKGWRHSMRSALPASGGGESRAGERMMGDELDHRGAPRRMKERRGGPFQRMRASYRPSRSSETMKLVLCIGGRADRPTMHCRVFLGIADQSRRRASLTRALRRSPQRQCPPSRRPPKPADTGQGLNLHLAADKGQHISVFFPFNVNGQIL
jgi:hypothetical protein